jgi:hypothetical protein
MGVAMALEPWPVSMSLRMIPGSGSVQAAKTSGLAEYRSRFRSGAAARRSALRANNAPVIAPGSMIPTVVLRTLSREASPTRFLM